MLACPAWAAYLNRGHEVGYTYVSVGGHFADLTGLDISSIYQSPQPWSWDGSGAEGTRPPDRRTRSPHWVLYSEAARHVGCKISGSYTCCLNTEAAATYFELRASQAVLTFCIDTSI